jgi:hypothetical protein
MLGFPHAPFQGARVIRVLPFVIEIALLVYCLVDAIQSDPDRVRNLAKGWWILLIIFMPVVGGVAWLVAGRPLRSQASAAMPWSARPTPVRRPLAPDDDPAFLAGLGTAQHERLLSEWEQDLKRREQALREQREADRPSQRPTDNPEGPAAPSS